jgi:hypothetical protein
MKTVFACTRAVKTRFLRFVQRVRWGGERKPGLLRGQITVHPGFDDVPGGFE